MRVAASFVVSRIDDRVGLGFWKRGIRLQRRSGSMQREDEEKLILEVVADAPKFPEQIQVVLSGVDFADEGVREEVARLALREHRQYRLPNVVYRLGPRGHVVRQRRVHAPSRGASGSSPLQGVKRCSSRNRTSPSPAD